VLLISDYPFYQYHPSTAGTDICSSAIALALPYYTPSMALYNICIPHIPVGCLVPKLQLGNAYPQALLDATLQAELGGSHSQAGAWEREYICIPHIPVGYVGGRAIAEFHLGIFNNN